MVVERCHTSSPRYTTCLRSMHATVNGTISIEVYHLNFSIKRYPLLRSWRGLIIKFHRSKKRGVKGCDFAGLRSLKQVVGLVYKEVIGVIVACWFLSLANEKIPLKTEEFFITGRAALFADLLNLLFVLRGVFRLVYSFKALKTIRPADSLSIFELF